MVITTYVRSSSYNTWQFCQHKCYLDYCLGFHSPANKSAQKGTIVHKALEILAQRKLAEQNGQEKFLNRELNLLFNVSEATPEYAIECAYYHYVNKEEFPYQSNDYTDCKRWFRTALEWKDGIFSPLKMDIVSPELYFDFEVKKPWAKYKYDLEGKTISGYLSLKGTLDLVTRRPGNTIEVVDWKTGRPAWDWVKNKAKEYEDFVNDPQLRLYHYAATHLYPEADHVFFTIFWLQNAMPISVCFEHSQLPETEDMIRRHFFEVKNTTVPELIYPNKRCSWCHFSKNSFDGPSDYEHSICKVVHDEILELGIEKVTAKRAKHKTFDKYGEGGGKTHEL